MHAERTSAVETHDYTARRWGHDYIIHRVIDGGQQLRMSGWGRGIVAGDFLILPNGGATTRYRVDTIDKPSAQGDQWFADVTFEPREEER